MQFKIRLILHCLMRLINIQCYNARHCCTVASTVAKKVLNWQLWDFAFVFLNDAIKIELYKWITDCVKLQVGLNGFGDSAYLHIAYQLWSVGVYRVWGGVTFEDVFDLRQIQLGSKCCLIKVHLVKGACKKIHFGPKVVGSSC